MEMTTIMNLKRLIFIFPILKTILNLKKIMEDFNQYTFSVHLDDIGPSFEKYEYFQILYEHPYIPSSKLVMFAASSINLMFESIHDTNLD